MFAAVEVAGVVPEARRYGRTALDDGGEDERAAVGPQDEPQLSRRRLVKIPLNFLPW